MLVNFTVENFRSFRDAATLSMVAAPIRELKESVLKRGRYRLLPVAVTYGANSSGKTNLLKAMGVMSFLVTRSSKLNSGEKLHYEPFLLDRSSRTCPTSFEVEFLLGEDKYRYGFSYDATHVATEYLYILYGGKRKERNLFLRSGEEYEINKHLFPEGEGLTSKTNGNRLFLTVVAQFNGKISQRVMEWFSNFNTINGLESVGYERFTRKMFHDRLPGYDQALQFFKDIQLGFTNLVIKEQNVDSKYANMLNNIPESMRMELIDDAKFEPFTVHEIRYDEGKIVSEQEFPEDEMESEGTKKVIKISGPVFDTLLHGKLLVIDELDAKLHPLLTRHIVKLFMDPEVNHTGAQLIFDTHDTNLLRIDIFRRDQIWFTEKNEFDSTDLYSLVEFKDEKGKVRNDRSLEKDYINGRYGAIPFIGGLSDEQE